jgi:uncharacterized membrane protein YphA (DoxX/SURF4 family)
MFEPSDRYRPVVHGLMRIVLTFTYWTHGAQKFAGWFGGFGPDGGTADLGPALVWPGSSSSSAASC